MHNTGLNDKKSKHVRVKLDAGMFDTAALRDEVSFEVAISILEGHLATAAVDKEHLLSQLFDTRGLFELIVHAMSSDGYHNLLDIVNSTFTTDPQHYEACFASTLLQRLSLYFGGLLLALPDMDDYYRAVGSARQTLKALAPVCSMAGVVEDLAEEVPTKGRAKRPSQRVMKRNKRAEKVPNIDTALLDRLGVAVPSSKEEALDLVRNILEGQKAILRHYLEILRRRELAETIKAACIPEEYTQNESSIITEPALDEEPESSFDDLIPAPAAPLLDSDAKPLKAALYFGSAEGFGEWRILIPQRAYRDLREAFKRNPPLFEIIYKKLKDLSHGHFSPDNQKQLDGSNNGIPIYEAKMTGDTRLVYRIDCIQEVSSDVEKQALRIYGIYTHAQIRGPRFWNAVSLSAAGVGKEYQRRCKFRSTPSYAGDTVYAPAQWPPAQEQADGEAVELPDLPMEEKQELRTLLVLEKFVPFSQALISCIASGQDPSHPFYMSREEQAIVLHPGSCFVLGRSGTGKTTTTMFKMVGIERIWHTLSAEDKASTPRPRQVFITQSAVLAEKVQEYFRKTFSTIEAEHVSLEDIETLAARLAQDRKAGDLINKDEEEEYREDLPKKFSELKDEHFPLFVTYHRLCRLLEADFAENAIVKPTTRRRSSTVSRTEDEDGLLTSNDYMMQQRDSFVSYTTFLGSYWAHFPQPLTKGLDPSSIYAEFMGVIRGSDKALKADKRYLDRAAYCAMSHRITMLDGCKDTIYSLFEAYMKRKMMRREYDAADRTQAIIKHLQDDPFPGEKVDFVYVDEVQDNLLIDTLILRSICRRPEGMFWAGDTAQTISAGSSFRFNNLTSFMFEVERKTNRHNPKMFQLTRNYRSHGGIVRCAQTVVDIITHLWPYSIDMLQEEKGLIDGPKPLFLGGGQTEVPHFEQFLYTVDGTAIEFGHQQCILVRNDAAREELRRTFGSVGLVLTLYESKGLEFEDVLLYNFFSDSTVSLSQWRVILKDLGDESDAPKSPTFDEVKHHGVCHELKSLYVAITRARLNLWIIDYSGKGAPMHYLWDRKGQVETWEPGTDVPQLAQSSSPEQWAATAERIFDQHNYKEAMHAYGRAGLPRERAVAEAYHLREVAGKLATAGASRVKDTERVAAYLKAAEAFKLIAEDAEENYARVRRYQVAADCYARAKDPASAAKCYERAEDYSSAAQHYRKAGVFDDAVRVAKTHGDRIHHTIVENIVEVSKLFYLKGGQLVKAKELFDSRSTEEVLEYADTYGLDLAKAKLLEETHDYAGAARLHLEEGRLAEAVRLYLRAPEDRQCADAITRHIMSELWTIAGLGTLDRDCPKFTELLSTASRLLKNPAFAGQRQELSLIVAMNTSTSTDLADLGISLLRVNLASALLCLDYLFQDFRIIESATMADALGLLQAFLLYSKHIHGLVFSSNSAKNEALQRLLAFAPTEAGQFHVRSDSLLQTMFTDTRRRTTESGSIVLERWELESFARTTLKTRLLQRLRAEGEACKRSKVFRVCLQHAVEGRCAYGNDCQRTHISSYDRITYQRRVSLHLIQISIYQAANGVEEWGTRQDQRRLWLARLTETLYPASTRLGSYHNLDDDTLFPEAAKAVHSWIADGLYGLKTNAGSIPHFLTNFLRGCFLNNLKAVEGAYIPEYVHRIPAVTASLAERADFLLRGNERVNIVGDILRMLTIQKYALASGILLVKHIVEKEIPIELSLLCELLDTLCGMLLLARRRRRGFSVHSLSLPQSWLTRLEGQFRGTYPGDTSLLWLYLQPMGTLLEQVYTGADHLRLGKSDPPFIQRSVFLARICHNICLFGYNLRDDALRDRIIRTFSSLRRPDRLSFPQSYRKYINAERWSYLARLVQENALGGDADPLIELIDRRKIAPPLIPGAHIRRITYNRVEEIPWLMYPRFPEPEPYVLSAALNPAVASGQPTATASLVHPADGSSAEDDAQEAEASREPEGQEAEQEDKEPVAGMAEQLEEESILFVDVQPAAREAAQLSPDDLLKICRAVEIYRNARSRPAKRTPSKMSLSRAREIKAYLEEAEKIDWSGQRVYRQMFLWALPHVLCALRGVVASLREGKAAAKKQLADPKTGHLKLDDLMAEITSINTFSKQADRMVKALQPHAQIHHIRDLQALENLARETREFMASLPVAVSQRWAPEMDVGLRNILTPKPVVLRDVRPDLVLDPEDDMQLAYM